MWLGDQITNKGIGNGVSMIIFIGIVSRLPSAVSSIWSLIMTESGFSTTGLLVALAIVIGALILVTAVVFIQQAERRIPVQYAKKVVGRKMMGAQNTYIPLKIAMAGVMPIIFASSFMTFPAMIIQIFDPSIATHTGFWNVIYNFSLATSSSNVALGYTIANAIVYLLLIVGFTFFYIYATFNPAEVSANIKKNGGFIHIIWWIILSTYSYTSNVYEIYKFKCSIWRNIYTYHSWCCIRNSSTIRITISNETLQGILRIKFIVSGYDSGLTLVVPMQLIY